jgi:alpha-tubulin suppressor-like RCC1 family protein
VLCWGYNGRGQLGDGTTAPRALPVKVRGLAGVLAIAARGFHACALLGEGNVRCWGDDIHGELGDGSHGRSGEMPVEVVGL